MAFHATTAQIADDFGVDYDQVIDTFDSLILSDQFKRLHYQEFALKDTRIIQMTEAGYNAIVMSLTPPPEPVDEDSDDDRRECLLKWREMFYANRAPSINEVKAALLAPQTPVIKPSPAAIAQATAQPRKVFASDDSYRQRAQELIANGEYDSIISQTFADIHRKISNDINGDPAYQNCRLYVIARRKQLGIE